MRVGRLLVVLAVVATACGGEDVDRSGSTDTTRSPATAGSTAVPDTQPPPLTAPATSLVEPTWPEFGDAVTLGPPDPALLPASPADEIDWTAVGRGWALIDHGAMYADPASPDERGLYLLSPDDVVYGVSALPADGSGIAVASSDGRMVLLHRSDSACTSGCSCPDDAATMTQVSGYALLDLRASSARPIIDPVEVSVCDPGVFSREVRFTTDGQGILVSETWRTSDLNHATRVRLSRVEVTSGTWSTILDEPIDASTPARRAGSWISVIEVGSGQLVTSTPDGIWLRDARGAQIRRLDAPDTSCHLARSWDAGSVLAWCPVTPGELSAPPGVPAEECYTSGLWLVPLDGTPARTLAISLDEHGDLSCWSGYVDAAPLGDWIAAQVGGDGCSDDVVVIAPDGAVTTWMPPDLADPCTESLIGVRSGAWLISADSYSSADNGIYAVTPAGSTRTQLPAGRIFVL